MGNLLVWILIFAGATIGLLATFLIASERELQAELYKSQESGAQPMAEATFMAEPAIEAVPLQAQPELDAHERARLKLKDARTGELKAEIETLKKPLASSEEQPSALDSIRRELADQRQMNGDLKDDNLRLRDQIFAMQRQLDIGMSGGQRLVLAQQRLSAILAQHETLVSASQEMQSRLVQLSALLINQPGVQAWPEPSLQKLYDEPRAENGADPIDLTGDHESAAVGNLCRAIVWRQRSSANQRASSWQSAR